MFMSLLINSINLDAVLSSYFFKNGIYCIHLKVKLHFPGNFIQNNMYVTNVFFLHLLTGFDRLDISIYNLKKLP